MPKSLFERLISTTPERVEFTTTKSLEDDSTRKTSARPQNKFEESKALFETILNGKVTIDLTKDSGQNTKNLEVVNQKRAQPSNQTNQLFEKMKR